MREGLITILVSLDIKGAFDTAWWPNILTTLKEFNCPRNLYNITKSYFSQRTAVMSTNTVHIEREVSKDCPQGSCFGSGFWNIQYNSFLNLDFRKQTKAIPISYNRVPKSAIEGLRGN